MNTPETYDVRGSFELQNGLAVGWCWSPQLASEALRVEILSDGRVIASGIAARLVLELTRPGVTDGYHGFLFVLPGDLSDGLLEARESRTGKVFARRLPRLPTDVIEWQRRMDLVGHASLMLHDELDRTAHDESRWSATWRAGGALLHPGAITTRSNRGLALRPIAEPHWTVILDLPYANENLTETLAWSEVTQLAPLLFSVKAELLVIEDERVHGFLEGVSGLRWVTMPKTIGDADRLNAAIELARGEYVAIFAPILPRPQLFNLLPDTLRARATLLGKMPKDVTIGGRAATGIHGAGLTDLLPLITHSEPQTGLLLLAQQTILKAVGKLDVAFDDGEDLALLDWGMRATAHGFSLRIYEDGLPPKLSRFNYRNTRQAFLSKWKELPAA